MLYDENIANFCFFQQTIRIDDDNEEFPVDQDVISHIGPIEGKILKGSDGRMYAFEMNRLTPCDANYVLVGYNI